MILKRRESDSNSDCTKTIEDIKSLLISNAENGNVTQALEKLNLLSAEVGQLKEIADRAYTDTLTKIPNRLALQEELEETIKNGEPFSLALIDLDKFKQINDTYGHDAGDIVLKTVATFLSSQFRKEDTINFIQNNEDSSNGIATRIGGDEFVIIIEGASPEKLKDKALKIECGLNQLSITYNAQEIRIGGSIGLVEYKPGMTAEDCLIAADAQMYKIKMAKKGSPYAANTYMVNMPYPPYVG